MDWLGEFVEAHFGDFVALAILITGVHLITHCSGVEACVRLGEGLVGAGLIALRLKSNGKGAS